MKGKQRKKFIECDYERLHTRVLESDIDEDEINQIIDVRTKCSYVTKTIDSGLIREVETYPMYLKSEMPKEWKTEKNKQTQKNLNNKNAQKNFIRKINTNFKNGDFFITFTYSNENLPKNHVEAKKDMQNFIRRLKRLIKKKELDVELKYVYVTEHSEGPKGIRCHHHVIMNSILSMEDVEGSWKLGRRNNIRKLDTDELWLTGVATYLCKDPKGKKRWCSSKNLKDPRITRNHSKFSKKKINNMVRFRDLVKEEMEKANPGYVYIDHEIFVNEHNGKPYIYARMRKYKE
ncbi:rolling circle replication-associated protein [Paraclostridium sordellii]|jgi:hypothetical protein|uniref:rolling circle replication-associated protein n=1 Tax=Paraclostridium sordellii TaxID=1505 RepID=UPI0005DED632|nr:hypothetical protein [Paeniclostridium sordellii]CEP50426.1 Uncharacterised protein [[Clostridium] sordellii] [Paeniclostridium sordellii]CEQ26988.1 Uncharacterised protein [[Clostridium] sordellii] [Paeniclostridium sordellii]DAU04070.1 MAG TPA: Replication associated protein [Caudoviricetes sp.]